MIVRREQLIEGCILTEDVFAVTSHPIIKKKTVLTAEHLEILKAFFIKKVQVEDTLEDGTPFSPEGPNEEEETETGEEIVQEQPATFLDYYEEAVQEYKTLFNKWVGGANVELDKVRSILHPLIEKMQEYPSKVLLLHHYNTRNNYLYHHAVSTALLSVYLAKKSGMAKKEWLQAGVAGALCDAGMAKLPTAILYNKEHLEEREYEEVKNHPYYSYSMVKEAKMVSEEVLFAVLQHHEREDGSGYPLQVKNDQIHKLSKIVSVADVYHAMTSERYYSDKQSPYKVIDQMNKEEFGKLDPQILKLLMDSLVNFSIGAMVRLSNGQAAKIIYIDNKYPADPMVRLHDTDEMIQLSSKEEPFIEEILSE
ncbi:HD-GYP domain-containing protein (c-di-GMP phosphodiesterase class II) [Salibacterium salarium]|uniref:HD-GYP domain-containing protein n=1 Tax=Salibacterium salarium TaxID=284579 RepID=UPI002784DF70|nr:HD domain-containing phosphohydrolase [Salibacterium salarium]MDQ0297619.1 HD-GYP domain-containing protein (c-di-GMP phosphodiesterase class II) [Salibacterium salarium]